MSNDFECCSESRKLRGARISPAPETGGDLVEGFELEHASRQHAVKDVLDPCLHVRDTAGLI